MRTPSMRRAARGLIVALAMVAGACAAQQTRPDDAPKAPAIAPGVYDVETGEKIGKTKLYDRLASRSYVVVGEAHDTKWHHRIQKKIFAALLERRPDAFALGMEMFERRVQSALDAYAAGNIDETTMLERTHWKNTWGMPPELYRPLWRLARKHGAPIAALNVPRTLTGQIARKGLEGLSDKQRARIPETIETDNAAQRAYLRSVFGEGGHPGEMNFEYMMQAQATWDETMAEAAVEFVRSRKGTEGMMIVAGRAHARKAFGIPPRIARRLQKAGGTLPADQVVSVLPFSVGAETPMGPVTLERLKTNEAADYVWIRRTK